MDDSNLNKVKEYKYGFQETENLEIVEPCLADMVQVFLCYGVYMEYTFGVADLHAHFSIKHRFVSFVLLSHGHPTILRVKMLLYFVLLLKKKPNKSGMNFVEGCMGLILNKVEYIPWCI
jgi:hypothetical protein